MSGPGLDATESQPPPSLRPSHLLLHLYVGTDGLCRYPLLRFPEAGPWLGETMEPTKRCFQVEDL